MTTDTERRVANVPNGDDHELRFPNGLTFDAVLTSAREKWPFIRGEQLTIASGTAGTLIVSALPAYFAEQRLFASLDPNPFPGL